MGEVEAGGIPSRGFQLVAFPGRPAPGPACPPGAGFPCGDADDHIFDAAYAARQRQKAEADAQADADAQAAELELTRPGRRTTWAMAIAARVRAGRTAPDLRDEHYRAWRLTRMVVQLP